MAKTKGIIAAGNPATAEAAARILEAGGNAFDAAVAANFASIVAEPAMNSFGGGGFMTAVTAEGKSMVYDFFCQTPRHKIPVEQMDFYPIEINFGPDTEVFHIGMASMAVPGSLAGSFRIYERFCTLPMAELLQPAIEFARDGVAVDEFQELDIFMLGDILRVDKDTNHIFFPKGERIRTGELFLMPELAGFLEALITEGQELFYKGEVARRLAEDCREKGGNISLEDLENYEVIEREPMYVPYRGRRVLTNPLPSLGGSLIALGLDQLAACDTGYAAGSLAHLQTLQPILAEIDRIHHTEGALQSSVWTLMDKYRGATTHFNVLDEQGNGVAITTSNGACSGYSIPGTGIMMNNMLGEAALLPHGFHTWTRDARLPSMMSPTIVLNADREVEIVCGTGGAGRIPGAILQVMHYLIDHDQLPEAALNLPRMHWRGGTCNVERGFPREVPAAPGQKDWVYWPEPSLFFGGVHHILQKDGKRMAAGDPRRFGVVREVK